MKEYSNDEITVYWDSKKCIHSTDCVKCLPKVFDPHKSPWINMKGASTEELTKAIDKCPSGALSYEMRRQDKKMNEETSVQIKTMKKGPFLVKGNCMLTDEDGTVLAKSGPFALCRCGKSKNKPYCDGSHKV